MSVWSKISDFWHDDFAPWFGHLFSDVVHAEVTVLLPIASAAAGAAAADIVTAAQKGDMSSLGDTLAKVLQDTAQQAQAAAITAGATSLLTAVTTAVAAHTQAVPLGGKEVPALPPSVPTEPTEPVEPTAEELAAQGKNPDGTDMTAKQRKAAGLPAL